MHSDLNHLPRAQQEELGWITQLLIGGFAEAVAQATQAWKKSGKVLKIVLFGSYSRDDWVDEPENGYQSDFDLLIIVSHKDLTDIADFWFAAEDKIGRDEKITRPVNIIVHTLAEVNQALARGEYFWVDIAREGIVLYDVPGSAFVTPMPLTAADAYEMSNDYFSTKIADVDRWLATVQFQIKQATADRGFRNLAAFSLHQATETAYACFLLVRTLYFPRSHNIKFLRSLAEDKEPRLIAAWPRETRAERRRFELVKRAYVEARYSANYEISAEDLNAIAACVRNLRDVVETVSLERLDELRHEAGL